MTVEIAAVAFGSFAMTFVRFGSSVIFFRNVGENEKNCRKELLIVCYFVSLIHTDGFWAFELFWLTIL